MLHIYINDDSFVFNYYSSVAEQGLVARQVLTEPKLQSLSNKVSEFAFSLSFEQSFCYEIQKDGFSLNELITIHFRSMFAKALRCSARVYNYIAHSIDAVVTHNTHAHVYPPPHPPRPFRPAPPPPPPHPG